MKCVCEPTRVYHNILTIMLLFWFLAFIIFRNIKSYFINIDVN